MLERPRPRFVEVRRLADGSVAFYFCVPKYYRKLRCEIANEPLGTSYEAACGEDGKGGRAAALNALFDEWNDQRKGEPIEQAKIARYGSMIGCSGNTRPRRLTPRKSRLAHAPTMSASCR